MNLFQFVAGIPGLWVFLMSLNVFKFKGVLVELLYLKEVFSKKLSSRTSK
jgi:hypothetical protein